MTPADTEERRHWMAVLARASADEIAGLLASLPSLPAPERLRAPETGLVMVRGRAGGDGGPFNLGEMTVTRCSVRLGEAVGHAYVAGRDKRQAELAALLDAALQDPARRAALMEGVIAPLAAGQQAARDAEARKAAATRVDFFAMQTTR
ncbi:phosphonate C-P lyase system protein PhnG [Roseomonas eburnea]|uniref:Phosphonate C-P lyase system protein PhnG n=1 Tax=Neoroseomonas eburnea TaxID=1346889 RepID=A0A9X9XD65_9PROT|nr:phosphonate C-P lyase system protein PhnG [Neoroseomonas eburnea]MBR0681651.1 phosphonate C-P lyase system protein PhnG [Neoroseomonas eburnea]